jgi:hypothetical protein
MLKQQYMTEENSMADRESFESNCKCSFCGQKKESVMGNTNNRSVSICHECVIGFASRLAWINPTDKKNYDEHLYDAIDYYKNKGMLNEKSIVIRDFNIVAKDDKDLKLLEEKMSPLVNCTKVGSLKPTFYYTRDNMGVDDFCFVGKDMIDNFIIHINRLSAWDKAQNKDHHWKGLSDHCPIIVDLQEKTKLA